MVARVEHRRLAQLLEADPDLADGLDSRELAAAQARAVAHVIELEPPAWDTTEIQARAEPGWLGLYVLDGLLIRRVDVGRRAACELFGPCDVIRPWDTDGDYDPLPISVEWLVLRPSRLAVLDTGFVRRIAPWPTINSRIVSRVAQRARQLALVQAVTHLPRSHARLLILFWLIAERWGRVCPEGIRIDLPVTHEVLGMLVGAHRPTVTIALQRLYRVGFLVRERHGRWLLTREAIESLKHPDSLDFLDGDDPGVAAQA